MRKSSSSYRKGIQAQMSSGVFLDQPVEQHAMELPPETLAGIWSDNSLLFMFEFHPGPGPPQPSGDDGFVGTGPDLKVILPARCNVRQLRLRLCIQAQEQNWLPDPLGLLDPEEYLLLYARGQDWYEVYDDYQIVRTLDIPWSHDTIGRKMARIVVMQPSAVDLKERREQQKGLVQLIGHDIDSEASDRLGELTFTRRKLASSRRLELNSRDEKAYATEPWTTSFPIPKDLQAHLSRKLPVTLHHLNRISFTVKVDLTVTPDILLKVFLQVMADQGFDCDPLDGLVLKVSGREEFLTGDFSLSDFLWVRQCMKSNQEVHLSVVPVAQIIDEGPTVIDWPLVDSFTGQSSSHEDLRLEGKDLDDVFMISLWDCDRRFRVKLLGFDIPIPPNKAPQSAYVEVSILLGNKVLSTVVSSPKDFADEVLWNEWLEFDMLLRNLPRGTKLGLTINTNDSNGAARESKTLSSGANKAPDCQQKGKGKVLYFVNLLLIDHRSLLSQGPHTLHMWPYPELEEEAFAYPADKLSSATNPDITDSMAITFLLDRYNFPVVLPNCTTPPVAFTSPPASPEHISSTLASSIDLARCNSASSASTASPISSSSPDTGLFSCMTKPARATSSAGSGQFSPTPGTSPPLSAVSPLCAPAFQHSTLTSAPLSDSRPPSPPGLPLKRRSYVRNSTTTISSSEDSNLSSSPNSLPTALTGANSPTSAVLAPQPSTSSKHLSADPPQTLRSHSPVSATNRSRLRRFREESFRYASNLPQFLRSTDWVKRDVVEDVHWLLGNWEPGELDLSVALELLGVDFIDERVRRLAVQRLEILSNDEVLKYLLQLVQILKVEPYHDSFLARYLIRRALRSKRIGHFFFWYVRSEVAGCPYFRQRMAVVLEAYLLGCGQAMLDGFEEQVQAVRALEVVACQIKQLYPTDLPATAAMKLQELLRNSDLPSEFLVPFDPRIRAGKILLDKCKVMASKKKPLWLEFCSMPSPISATPVGIIFKLGDDLRQDMLVIQTLMVMDSIWQERSLDLCLVPYGCISTGQNIGMIEIVRDAVTIATVQKTQGGNTAAFANDALFEWLKNKCPFQEIHCQSVERFVNSCAGYCVATYVLGIGDRHNDNIMVTDQGNLFHIDFGHILGHRKRFLGVNRERVPFVLTPDFLYVMGRVKGRTSLYFQRFRDTCTQAYLLLRSHSRLLVTLFSLMLLTGIPELSSAEDMHYLREALQEDRAEEVAREHFHQQIALCEQLGWTVQANWWIHMVAGIK